MNPETLRAMAKDVLSFVGQQDIEEMIVENDFEGAKNYLLGALDARVEDKMIGEEQARLWYTALNLDPERVRRMRQSHQDPELPPIHSEGH